MNPYAMRFAVIRFMPYIQTREFANIGIIITHPKSGYFNFKIEHRYSRLSKFFRHFEPAVYKAVTKAFAEELTRIRQLAATSNPDQIRAMLDHLARPREAVIMAAAVGATIAENPADELERLFDYYVGHSFAKEPQEEKLTQAVTAWVRNLNLDNPFTEQKIGNEEYNVRFPLVQKNDGRVDKIIKPIYLGHEEASAIYQKGDQWRARFKRLHSFGMISKNTGILLPYIPPANPTPVQKKAFDIVLDDFEGMGIIVVDRDNKKAMTNFIC